MIFMTSSWDEISCEFTQDEVSCDDTAEAVAVATSGDPDPDSGWPIVYSHRINQNRETGWFIQCRSDRGHLAVITAISLGGENEDE